MNGSAVERFWARVNKNGPARKPAAPSMKGPAMLARDIGIPRAGFWKYRMVRNGPYVPAMIEDISERDPETGDLMEDQRFRCVVNGVERDAWAWAERLNLYGTAINEAEYQYLTSVSDWAKQWAPDAPEAAPTEAINPLTSKTIF